MRGVRDRERLHLGPAAEVLPHDRLGQRLAREVAGQLVGGAGERPQVLADGLHQQVGRVLGDPAAVDRGPRPPRTGRTPRACSEADFTSVTVAQLAEPGEQAAALLATGVHEHQPDVLRRARPRSRAGRRGRRRAGPPARARTTQRIDENSEGAARSPSTAMLTWSAGGLADLGLRVGRAHRRDRRRDRALVEELLGTGHERDVAENVGCSPAVSP